MKLALTPTPLHRLDRISADLGLDLYIKRDDLTGFGLSGNKVRKLQLLLQEALAQNATAVITTGGIQSNHCRATSVACRMLGLQPILLLRGEEPGQRTGNLLLNDLLGAEVFWCTADEYRDHRDERMRAIAERSEHKVFIIPEGGSNSVGAHAFELAAVEVQGQVKAPFEHTYVAVGSGGTLAGLATANHALGTVHGVAVCDDRAYFSEIVHRIAGPNLGVEGVHWEVVEGFVGEGYGVAGPEIWDTIRYVARMEGLFLDPTYTGKAMHALLSQKPKGRVLFWHTGGAFALFR